MPKGTSRAEAMSNSEKTKPVASLAAWLILNYACLKVSVSHSVSQSVSLPFFSIATFRKKNFGLI